MASIVFNGVAAGATEITAQHFGLNFVPDYERIGDLGWQSYDEVVANMGAQVLRYPGGVFSETLFDLRNPNVSEINMPDGSLKKVMPLHDFLAYCKSVGVGASVVIPTTQVLTQAQPYGSRTFDESWYGDVFQFVYDTLNATGGDAVTVFELGNEYEGYMTSQEYGKVASRLAKITQNAIDKFKADKGLGPDWEEPEIAVQSWSYNVQGSLTLEQQEARNAAVMAQFSADEIAAVDRIVSHYYYDEGRYLGETYEQTQGNIENAIFSSVNILDEWERTFGKSFTLDYSEWNVFGKTTQLLGQAQLPAMISMFETFTELGVDALSLWSGQYHATSAGLNNGSLTVAGELLRFMQDELLGFTALDTSENIQDAEVSAFIKDNEIVLFLSSTSPYTTTFTLDPTISFAGYEIVGAQTMAVDTTTADGTYRLLDNLPIYMEPDLPAFITDFALPAGFANTGGTLTLAPHQTIILRLNEVGVTPPPPSGSPGATDQNDVLDYAVSQDSFVGLGGFDIVSATNSGSAVDLDLQYHLASDGSARFVGIEGLTGSSSHDVLRGDAGNNRLDGGAGNDRLVGRDGNDSILGGLGDDTIFGGTGDDLLKGNSGADVIYGQVGNDIIWSGGGHDSVFGGQGNDVIFYTEGDDTIAGEDGIDTLNFENVAGGVSVWAGSQMATTDAGDIKFSGIEEFEFGAGADSFHSGIANGTTVRMGAGQDKAVLTSDGNHVSMGAGDDFIVSEGQQNILFGGAGNDTIYSYSGSIYVAGGTGDDIVFLAEGEDIFIFHAGDGNDILGQFDVGLDQLAMDSIALDLVADGNYQLTETGAGTVFTLGNGQGSITFNGLSSSDVSLALQEAALTDSLDFL